MARNKLILAATIISSLFFSVFIVLLNIKILAESNNFYHNEFKKYNVYEALNGYDIEKINAQVADFVLFKKKSLPLESFFSVREIKHLEDVRVIFSNINILLLMSFIILISYLIFLLLYLKMLKKALYFFSLSAIIGCLIVLIFSFFVFLSIKLNFDFSFEMFHSIFFERGTYTFNPQYEKIVVMYPEGLFYDAGQKILLNSVLSALLIIFYSSVVYKIYK